MDRKSILAELEGDILPFWMRRMTDPKGGFLGRMNGDGYIVPGSEKGAILNSRILWTFASAYRVLGKKEYLDTATRAYHEIRDRFTDKEYGGIFWSLDSEGRPKDTKKQFYAIAFAIYGLSEYFRATGDEEALELAKSFYHSIEEHSLDPCCGGYIEACTREWGTIEDMRLSDKDQNDAKTMNTHLHILEGYTNLYRVWKDSGLRGRLFGLINIFIDRIIRPDGHLGLFFGDDWAPHSTAVSYGHDIEASWLLDEATEVLGDKEFDAKVKSVCAKVAAAAMEGFSREGGMIYEYDPATGRRDSDRHWWGQAETVVGCLNQYQKTGEATWLESADNEWSFIRHHLIRPDGEWYWSIHPDDTPNTTDDLAGFWKCPYHNGRMCLEVLERGLCSMR